MRLISVMAIGLSVVMGGAASHAQDNYPSHPIKFVQGFPAGGNADAITRVLGAEMAKGLGQPVISEARVGAGGRENPARAVPRRCRRGDRPAHQEC